MIFDNLVLADEALLNGKLLISSSDLASHGYTFCKCVIFARPYGQSDIEFVISDPDFSPDSVPLKML